MRTPKHEATKRAAVTVRPRSSMRKSRSALIEHSARKPLQERSLHRFERILSATEALLQTANLEDISFYDIARQADISPASVNYLFPTMAALRIELMKTYAHKHADGLIAAQRAMTKMRNASWQEWIRVLAKRAQETYNANRPMSEVVLGPVLHRESRRAQLEENVRLAQAMVQSFRQMFVVPALPELEVRFAMMYNMFDGLWSAAYILHGRVDDFCVDESVRMRIAYLRTILPETLPLVIPRK